MGRAPCCDKARVKRGPWAPDEDELLRSYLAAHGGAGNWITLPQKAGLNRCGKSCRLRWLNYLRPNIRLGSFSPEEDDLISSLYNSIGSRWSVIASHLPGRTDNDVKNHWNTKLKKKLFPNKNTRKITCSARQVDADLQNSTSAAISSSSSSSSSSSMDCNNTLPFWFGNPVQNDAFLMDVVMGTMELVDGTITTTGGSPGDDLGGGETVMAGLNLW